MSNYIAVVGSCMIDFLSYTPKLPKAGETVVGTKFTTGFGGKGGNQCVAAAKLGGKTKFVARLGDDTWGLEYLKSLKDAHVDTLHVHITQNCSSGIAQITVENSGQNQIVVVGGANKNLSLKDIDDAEEVIKNASVLACQLEISIESVIRALELCQGVTMLNGAPAIKNCDKRLLTLPSIFCVNETEASIFTDLPVNDMDEAKIAVKKLLELGCNNVILTLGAQGVLQASKTNPKILHVQAPKVTPLDTTGAGDAFIGALAYLMAEHPQFSLEDQMKLACEMAANSVTKPGTQISFPDELVLKEHLKHYK